MAPTASPSLQFSTLLGSTIESIIHELLYSRSIYPPDSFVLHRHLGVRCHASRVPQVGDYIADFLRVAIPSIVSGVGDNLSLVILDEEVVRRGGNGDMREVGERTGGTKTVERFVFQFQMNVVIGSPEKATLSKDSDMKIAIGHDRELVDNARSQFERSMRECLLRVLALRKRRRRKDEKAENMSFKLCLHVAEDKKLQNNEVTNGVTEEGRATNTCPELIKALRQGEWLQPEESSCHFSSTSSGGSTQNSKGLLRPINDVNLPSCGMNMQMGMEVDPFE